MTVWLIYLGSGASWSRTAPRYSWTTSNSLRTWSRSARINGLIDWLSNWSSDGVREWSCWNIQFYLSSLIRKVKKTTLITRFLIFSPIPNMWLWFYFPFFQNCIPPLSRLSPSFLLCPLFSAFFPSFSFFFNSHRQNLFPCFSLGW